MILMDGIMHQAVIPRRQGVSILLSKPGVLCIAMLGWCWGVWGQVYSFTTPLGDYNPAPLGQTGDSTNNAAQLAGPEGVALDKGGNLYIADGNAIRRASQVGANWVLTTLAGEHWRHGTNDGPGASALLNAPGGIAVDALTNLYVADTANNSIRKIAPAGGWVVSTIAGTSVPADFGTGSADGTNGAAQFYQPGGIALDAAGNLYVADTDNHTIRKVALVGTNWVTTTLAGKAADPGFVDATNSIARFQFPNALVVDTNGNIFVADQGNNAIREVSPVGTNWVVTTIAGSGEPGSEDGTNLNAQFNAPQGLAMDSGHRLYVTDSGNNTIRKVEPVGTNWVVSTLAGQAGVLYGYSDGTGAAALFNNPFGIAVDNSLNLYVADDDNFTIRHGTIAPLLHVCVAAGQVILSWPAGLSGYVCEASSSLAGGWGANTSGITTQGDWMVQTNSARNGSRFFRLRAP